MSIQSEISRITTNIANSLTAVAAKGVTVPSGSTSDDLPTLIAAIQQSGGQAIVVTEEPDTNGGTKKIITAVDLAGDTVTAEHLQTGYTAHDQFGNAITGTYSGGSSPQLKMGAIRPDAELVTSFTYDKLWVTDDEGTIPAYTSTSTTVYTGAALSPTVALDLENYSYFVLIRTITTPVYNNDAKSKGKPDYSMTSGLYEITEIPGNTVQTINGTKIAARLTGVFSAGAMYRMPYWSSTTAAALYTASTYGINQTVVAPTISSASSATPNLTIKSPNMIMRGSSTYFNSTNWGYLTDIRRQYVIEVYRAPKENLNLDGWGLITQFNHINECAQSTNQKLT